MLYMEGYLYDRADAKAAFRHAARAAHRHGRLVSLTLSDSFCVDRHRDDFLSLVRDEVDLLFGNDDELLSLYQTDNFDDAVAAVRRDCSAGGDHGRRQGLLRRHARRRVARRRPTRCAA